LIVYYTMYSIVSVGEDTMGASTVWGRQGGSVVSPVPRVVPFNMPRLWWVSVTLALSSSGLTMPGCKGGTAQLAPIVGTSQRI